MDKKGSAIFFIIVGFIILVVVLVIVALIVASQKGFFNKETPQENPNDMELFVKAQGNETFSYMIQSPTNFVYSTGELRDSYIPVKVPSKEPVSISCWSADHYVVRSEKSFEAQEIHFNKSKADCTAEKIGVLKIDRIQGDLSKDVNRIIFNLTAVDGGYRNLGLCFRWSAGIIKVTNIDDELICEQGLWKNYSAYYAENNSYSYLPPNQFKCGEKDQECISVEGNRCKLKEISKPLRYERNYDRCSQVGLDIKEGQTIQVRLDIPTIENKNVLDFVDILFYDSDLRFDSSTNTWKYISEESGRDIGAVDQIHTIEYKENVQ